MKAPESTVDDFFAELGRRGHEPMLRRISGTIRFDLDHGGKSDHFTVTVAKGDLSVSRRNAAADTVIHTDRALFERMVTGRANASASMLRGLVGVSGDLELATLAPRLFAAGAAPAPAPAPAPAAGSSAGSSTRTGR
jgi:putative sterol carrier protein